MKLRGRIPVDPLSDERMTNIERRVVAGATIAPARTRWVPLAAAALAVVVAGVIGSQLGTQPPRSPELAVAAPPIRIDTMERTTLDIGDATITSDPRTQLVVTRPAGGVLVEMARGKVELEVGKRGPRPPLVVRAGDTDVIVVGTHFSVDYGDGTGTAIVEVMEGVVNVVRRTQPAVRVAAGQGFTAKRGMITAAELHTELAGSAQIVPSTIVASAVALPGRSAPPPPPPSMVGKDAGKKVMTYTEDLHGALRKQPIAPAFDVGDSDPEGAIVVHNQAAAGRGAEASRALYSIAVIQLLQQRDPVKSLATLERYFSRFSHKNEHAEALWLRLRILCERSFDERCRHAAAVYVREVPTGAKTGMAERISGTVE